MAGGGGDQPACEPRPPNHDRQWPATGGSGQRAGQRASQQASGRITQSAHRPTSSRDDVAPSFVFCAVLDAAGDWRSPFAFAYDVRIRIRKNIHVHSTRPLRPVQTSGLCILRRVLLGHSKPDGGVWAKPGAAREDIQRRDVAQRRPLGQANASRGHEEERSCFQNKCSPAFGATPDKTAQMPGPPSSQMDQTSNVQAAASEHPPVDLSCAVLPWHSGSLITHAWLLVAQDRKHTTHRDPWYCTVLHGTFFVSSSPPPTHTHSLILGDGTASCALRASSPGNLTLPVPDSA